MIFGVSRWFENDFSKFYIEFSLDSVLSNPTIRHFDKNNNFWDYDLFFISGSKYYYLPGEEYKDFVDVFYVYTSGVLEFKFLGQETSPDIPQPLYKEPETDPIPELPKFFLEEINPKELINEEFGYHTSSSQYPYNFTQKTNYHGFRTLITDFELAADSASIFYKSLEKPNNISYVGFGNPEEISLDNFNEKLADPEKLFQSEDNGRTFLIQDDFSVRVAYSNFFESKSVVYDFGAYYKDVENSSYTKSYDRYVFYDNNDFYFQLYSLTAKTASASATSTNTNYTTLNNFIDYENEEVPSVFKTGVRALEDSYKINTTFRYYMVVPPTRNIYSFIEKMSSRKGFGKNYRINNYNLNTVLSNPPATPI